jgi:hypothetical protein
METALIYGGTSCDTVHTDDSRYMLRHSEANLANKHYVLLRRHRYRACKKGEVPIPYVNFNKVRDVNEWWGWLDLTVMPNVRVQPWYNGKQPYGLR